MSLIFGDHIKTEGLREIKPADLCKGYTNRYLLSSVILPSQYQAYSLCTEFAKEWFLDKFNKNYFNSIYVEGKHSFDEFRKFSEIDDQLKRVNPILAIVPVIDMSHNRDWIDSTPEIPLNLRRTKMEGTFFNDLEKGIHVQLMFKTIKMSFNYKIRLNTRAEQLDMFEYIKIKHRAGWSESKEVSLDIHVPKEIMVQMAYDAGIQIKDNLITEPIKLLNYANSHSYLPFLYKMRCVNGNNEFFVKVPNCMVHLKSEMPSMDDGERQNALTTNYTIDFNVEFEMTAPYMYTYYSQKEQTHIIDEGISQDNTIVIMKSVRTQIPDFDEHKWQLYTTTEYMVDKEDLNQELEIDFDEFFEGTDLKEIMHYTKNIALHPSVFINFKFFNDGEPKEYEMDWTNMKCKLKGEIYNVTTVIGIYCDMAYINNVMTNLEDMDKSRISIDK